jgi:hypothetical protein
MRKCSLGLVTLMVRAHVKAGAAAELVCREHDKGELLKENIRLAKDRAIKLDVAVNTKLCALAGMKVALEEKEGEKGQTLIHLKAQYWARVTGRDWTCNSIGPFFRIFDHEQVETVPPRRRRERRGGIFDFTSNAHDSRGQKIEKEGHRQGCKNRPPLLQAH